MRVGDLFSGIGGFALATHAVGAETAWFAEVDPFCCATLEQHFPHVPNLGDVRAIDYGRVPPVDLITAGFPCQPHSVAGKQQASEDDRDLWPEVERCLRELRPRGVVLENVPGLLASESGRFFGRVLGALAALGYDAEWDVVGADAVGAPHPRERLWIVGWLGDGVEPRLEGHAGDGDQGYEPGRQHARACGSTATSGVCMGQALPSWDDAVAVVGGDGSIRPIPADAATRWTESPVFPLADGVPGRVARLRAVGNAVVPAVAAPIIARCLERIGGAR